MNKTWKYILIGAAVAVVCFLAWLVLRSFSESAQVNNSNNGSISEKHLNAEKENSLKEFVKNFSSLYNTYRYQDYTNLTALGDYQTVSMQQKTVSLVEQLAAQTPAGFNRQTEVDISTFKYSFVNNVITATVVGRVTESQSENISPRDNQSENSYQVLIKMTVQPQNQGWLADDIKINKL